MWIGDKKMNSKHVITFHEVLVKNNSDLPLPIYQKRGDSGVDLMANLPEGTVCLNPGEMVVIDTGLQVAIPDGLEIQIRSRSGLAAKQGVFVLNSPGSIDSSFRGKLGVILYNLGKNPFEIKHGDRIAQAILCPVCNIYWGEVTALPETDRGEGGFGSTGV